MAIQVDPAYYHMPDPNYSKFADAVMDVGQVPVKNLIVQDRKNVNYKKLNVKHSDIG